MTRPTPAPRAYGRFKVRDGCEWNPDRDRGSEVDDRHFRTTLAAVVTVTQIPYRLCDRCAALPRFRTLRQVRLSRQEPLFP